MRKSKEKGCLMTILTVVLLVFAALPLVQPIKAQHTSKNLVIQLNVPNDYNALKTGTADIMTRSLSAAEYYDAITDPNIILGPVLENNMFEFDINNNETIKTYPGTPSPTSYLTFRRALALFINKTYIVEGICGDFAERMDAPVPKSAHSWINTSVVYPNYPWETNFAAAIENLTAGGFVEGITPNPYYDPSFPWSSEYIRVYPTYAIVHDNPQIGVDITGPYEWTLSFPAVEDPQYTNWRVMGKTERLGIKSHYFSELPYTFDLENNKISIMLPISVGLQNGTYLWIEYLTPHPKAGEDLDYIIFVPRQDHAQRFATAEYLRDIMRKVGIPVLFYTGPWIQQKVEEERDYHIYTGGWKLGRFPTSMYYLYHSKFWYPMGPNFVAPPCPIPRPGPSIIDPNYDIFLEDMYNAEDIPAAITAAKKVQGIHVMKVVNIPLWCTKSFYAWRNWLLGVVNMGGYGPANDYTFLHAYINPGAPVPDPNTIRAVTSGSPLMSNILFSSWMHDYLILDRIWQGGSSLNPYDIGRDQPWIVQDWNVSKWIDPDDGENKTKVTYWLRKDILWVAPITGTPEYQFNASDVEFSNMFSYAFSDGWNWDNTKDVDHINIVDPFCYEVCFKSKSIWLQYAANYPLLPKYKWLTAKPLGATDPFCTITTYTELGASYAAGDSLYLTGDKVAQVQNITVDEVLLTDYWMRFNSTGGVYSANRIYFPSEVSGDLVINYWNITGDPHGSYPGSDTDWLTTTYSIGPWVPTDITPNAAVFKLNDYFYLSNLPLDEVDWYWWWGERDSSRPAPQHLEGPRTGCFIVDIYDVTYSTVSYGSTGYLEPTTLPPWFPGADLASSYTPTVPYGGEIDIYDVSTILISYGQEFGHPPTGSDP